MGDFNCLTREDYSTEEWEKIALIRSQNEWEAPSTLVVEKLKEVKWALFAQLTEGFLGLLELSWESDAHLPL